jgi:hypothetical protein
MLLLLLSALVYMTYSLAFFPMDHNTQMWDTWLYRNGDTWILNYLSTEAGYDSWDSVSTALSTDGVHFADVGVSIRKDCAAPPYDCSVWLGSGSVWRYVGANNTWIMNYSQQYNCFGDNCQSIFFATTNDFITWTPVAPDSERKGGIVFKYNATNYQLNGRWDCIAVIPKANGGYYGYWTATPVESDALCGKNKSCGAGFGQSDDGLIWEALPTPGPAVPGEVAGVAQINGRIFMTFDAGHLYEAGSPSGPFVPSQNYEFLLSDGGSYFPRLWGELYTQDPNLVLITHQQIVGKVVYAGLVKRAALGDDGVLRAVWWEANDNLQGGEFVISYLPSGFLNTTCTYACLTSGMWISGKLMVDKGIDAGLWLETSTGGTGFGLWNDPSNSTFYFRIGTMKYPSFWDPDTLFIDRSLSYQPGQVIPWKAILRNTWNNVTYVEFYVNDVLTLPYSLSALADGVFSTYGGASIDQAFHLTLPKTTG